MKSESQIISFKKFQEIFSNLKYDQLRFLLGVCNDIGMLMDMLVNELVIACLMYHQES